jgi:preprotein translocase subunit SecF
MTFLAVLSIYLFGGEALRGFSFTMLVGIISGTYSTIFIASAIAILLSGKDRHAAAAAAPAGDAATGQGGRKSKRAKAS